MRVCIMAATILLMNFLASQWVNAANNPLHNKIVDGNGKPFLSPRGGQATLTDLGLGKIPPGNNTPVRIVPWSKIPGEISQMAYVGDRLFFATVKGKIWEYNRQGNRHKPELLNIPALRPAFSMKGAYSGRGLRGVAFHPDFSHNGLLYTMHLEMDAKEQATHGKLDSKIHYVLAEWQLTPSADNTPAKKAPLFRSVLRVGYEATDHVGGQIGFNPAAKPGDADYGMIYVGFGDGGDVCAWSKTCINQFRYGQNFSTIQSSIIRINPLKNGPYAYSIPEDNPFLQGNDPHKKIADEIFAKGFRNPATMMFDQENGHLFIGDISQNSIEEINLIEKGKNYGWGILEGTWLFTDLHDTDNKLRYLPLGDGSDVTALSATYPNAETGGKSFIPAKLNRLTDNLTSPVIQFSHEENGGIAAVVTGTAYRGKKTPELSGLFLFGNLSQDKMYYAHQNELVNDESPATIFELNILDEQGKPASLADIIIGRDNLEKTMEKTPNHNQTNIRFGQDSEGNIYIVSKHNNVIYRLLSP